MLDLRGLGTTDAVRRIAAMIDAAQADYLIDFEMELKDAGADCETIDASVERYRGDLTALRDQVLERARALLERHGTASY